MSSRKIDRELLPKRCAYCKAPLRFNFLMKFTGFRKTVTAFHIKCYYKNELQERIESVLKIIREAMK